ncbi:hypothetical protein CQW23_14946 [Capsicum baccatum]|uniref:Uncharacterized protein n=1 Tax=Capsicum baccatum TaxID=33114 RepID=A0A2G2WKM7_CAPBA|nr:hypothetical protein CQW23_14946 [Capsicum baccatum]
MHYNTSYWMCWKGSVIAKNIIRGTPEHEYAGLLAFSHIVELLNPSFSYSIMVNKMDGSFAYYFLAFRACIQGYAHLKKVNDIDEKHLYDKYGCVSNSPGVHPGRHTVLTVISDHKLTHEMVPSENLPDLVGTEVHIACSDAGHWLCWKWYPTESGDQMELEDGWNDPIDHSFGNL